jgi:thiamine pyrophosphokinase
MRAVIFANGKFPDLQNTRHLLRPGDWIIAANGGARRALAAGVVPHLLIGDLDSLLPDELERLAADGVQLIRFSPRKDETDLELALQHAAREGATEIVILAALGGRLDQTIANLWLLALPELSGISVRVVGGAETAFLIRDEALIEGRPGDIVSLIPMGGDAVGVTTEGLEWPLRQETLRFGPARGISNVLTAEQARVRVQQGLLLCVVTQNESTIGGAK